MARRTTHAGRDPRGVNPRTRNLCPELCRQIALEPVRVRFGAYVDACGRMPSQGDQQCLGCL